MSVSSLIESAKRNTHAVVLEGEALADLRQVIKHNATAPRPQRVTYLNFLEHLRKAHKVTISQTTLQRIVKNLGKSWQ